MSASITVLIVVASFYFSFIIGQSISGPINQLKSVMTNVEKGSDLSLRAELDGSDEVAKMGEAFNKMLLTFSTMIQSINGSSQQLSTSAKELSIVSEVSMQAIIQQLEEISAMTAASKQMSSSSQEIALNTNVVDATSSINNLVDEIERTTAIILDLEKGSTNIGSVLDVIRSIAEQTNLLALNAAIEAARAGEHGRGFAVIADEVRNLANKTQEPTEEIQTMIEKLQRGTSAAVKAMEQGSKQAQSSSDLSNQATSSISDITVAVSRISEMNIQIANAAEEQSMVTEEISRKIASVSTISHQASDAAQQSASGNSQVANLADELKNVVSIFKT